MGLNLKDDIGIKDKRKAIEETIDDVVDTHFGGDDNLKKLLKETAAHESHFGELSDNIMQVDDDEIDTLSQLDYLPQLSVLGAKWTKDKKLDKNDLKTNIILGTMRYMRTMPGDAPASQRERYKIWKEYYNTKEGKGTPESWKTSLKKFGLFQPEEKESDDDIDWLSRLNPISDSKAEASNINNKLGLVDDLGVFDKSLKLWDDFGVTKKRDVLGEFEQAIRRTPHVIGQKFRDAFEGFSELRKKYNVDILKNFKEKNPDIWQQFYGDATPEELHNKIDEEAERAQKAIATATINGIKDIGKDILTGGIPKTGGGKAYGIAALDRAAFGGFPDEELKKELSQKYPVLYTLGEITGTVGSLLGTQALLLRLGIAGLATRAGKAALSLSRYGPRFVPPAIVSGATYGTHSTISELIKTVKEKHLDTFESGKNIVIDTALGSLLGGIGKLSGLATRTASAGALGFTAARMQGASVVDSVVNGVIWGLMELFGSRGRDRALKAEALNNLTNTLADWAVAKNPKLHPNDAKVAAERFIYREAQKVGGLEKVLSEKGPGLDFLERANKAIFEDIKRSIKKPKAEVKPEPKTEIVPKIEEKPKETVKPEKPLSEKIKSTEAGKEFLIEEAKKYKTKEEFLGADKLRRGKLKDGIKVVWKTNKEGGQNIGNKQIIKKPTIDDFEKEILPRTVEGYFKGETVEEKYKDFLKKEPDTAISYIDTGEGWKVNKIDSFDAIASDVEQGIENEWAMIVDDFDERSEAFRKTADSEINIWEEANKKKKTKIIKQRKKPKYNLDKAAEKGDYRTLIKGGKVKYPKDLLDKNFTPEERKLIRMLFSKEGVDIDSYAGELKSLYPWLEIETGDDLIRLAIDQTGKKQEDIESKLEKEEKEYKEYLEKLSEEERNKILKGESDDLAREKERLEQGIGWDEEEEPGPPLEGFGIEEEGGEVKSYEGADIRGEEKQVEKQPWEMTREEFFKEEQKKYVKKLEELGRKPIADRVRKFTPSTELDPEVGFGKIIYGHKLDVEQALSEGKPVPEEVLKDYPDLQEKAKKSAKEKINEGKIFKSDITSDGGKQYPSGTWEVVSNTEKTIKLKLLKKDLMGGGLQDLVEEGETITINKTKSPHTIREWEDGSFTIYPFQSGTPQYFEQIQKETKPSLEILPPEKKSLFQEEEKDLELFQGKPLEKEEFTKKGEPKGLFEGREPKAGGQIHNLEELTPKEKEYLKTLKPDSFKVVTLDRDVDVKVGNEIKHYKKGEDIYIYQDNRTGRAIVKDGDYGVLPKKQVEQVEQAGTKALKTFEGEEGIKEIVKGGGERRSGILRDEIILSKAQKLAEEAGEKWSELGPNGRQRFIEIAEQQYGSKYSTYQSLGGKNYREILFVTPESQVVENYLESIYGKVPVEKYKKALKGFYYKSPHWDEPNVISHARVSDVKVGDKKYLAIEEIQSDWALEGRKKGFITTKKVDPEEITVREWTDSKGKKRYAFTLKYYGYTYVTDNNDINEAINHFNSLNIPTKGVPYHPLLKKWKEFTLKRLLEKAVKEGYNGIIWTTGEQQTERYDLSKQIDYLQYKKNPDNTYNVSGFKDEQNVISKQRLNKNQLEGLVGKDIAKKIINSEGYSRATGSPVKILEGENLKIGGEWAKSLYDVQMPSILKKFGGKLTKINGQSGIEITPEIRKMVYGEVAGGGKPAKEVREGIEYNADKPLDKKTIQNESPLAVKFKKHGHIVFPGEKITSPQDVAFAFRHLKNEATERFYIVGVKNMKPVSIEPISIGGMTFAPTSTYEPLLLLLSKKADGYFLVHNHPSGNPTPSREDRDVSEAFKKAYGPLGLEYKGHVVINDVEFGFIDSESDVSLIPYKLTPPSSVKKVSAYHKYVEWYKSPSEIPALRNAEDVVNIMKGLTIDYHNNYYAIFLSNDSRILSSEMIPRKEFSEEALAKRAVRVRANSVILINPPLSKWDAKDFQLNLYNKYEIIALDVIKDTGVEPISFYKNDDLYDWRVLTKLSVGPRYLAEGGYGPIAYSEKEGKIKKPKADYSKIGEALPSQEETTLIKEFFKIISPANVSKSSKASALVLRKNLAELAHRDVTAMNALKKAYRAFMWLDDDEAFDFIDRIENGEKQKNPDLQRFANTIRSLLDQRREEVRALGKGHLESFYENYFPHIWKDPKKAKNVILQIMGKRRLEGTKSFLKKRIILTIKEGIERGLEPVSTNPVDLVLLKLHEMDRYLMAQNIIRELKGRGLLKFVYSKSKPPDGYAKINDSAFTVYMPPEMTVKEAYDVLLVDQLMDLAKSLGVDVKRFVRIGGKRLGYASFDPMSFDKDYRVRTRFASPESVLAHEIGHIIGFEYGVYDLIRRSKEGEIKVRVRGKNKGQEYFKPSPEAVAWRKLIDKQWRDLADKRAEGLPRDKYKSYYRYIRNSREKEAVLVEAIIHAPDLFKKVAPDLYKAFVDFLNAHSELRPLLDIKPSLRLGESHAQIKIPGFTILGHYYAPEEVARLINNHLSPGLRNANNKLISSSYNIMRGVGNILNQINLSLSLFHAINVSTDMMASTIGLAIRKLITKKQRVGALKDILSFPIAPIINIWKGSRIKKAYQKQLNEIKNPVLRKYVRAIIEAGGRDRLDVFYYNRQIKALEETFRNIIKKDDISKLIDIAKLPFNLFGATLEVLAKPIMEWLVPTGKLGLFCKLAEHEFKRVEAGEITEQQLPYRLAAIWDSVDNRMGQLIYDNLFWHKILKDTLMLTIRSVGWNLGSWREYAGAMVDLVNLNERLKEGDKIISHKMSYVIGAAIVYAIIGAITTYILTGEGPKEIKDYFFPPDGGTNPDGSKSRWTFPTYAKDVYAYTHRPTRTIVNKLHPLVGLIYDLVRNRDYRNVEIVGEKDNVLEAMYDVAKYIANYALPFSFKNYQKMRRSGESEKMARFVSITGIGPAPAYITRTPAQKLMYRYIAEHFPRGSRTQEQAERSEYKKLLKDKIRKGEPFDIKEAREILGPRELRRTIRDAKRTPFEESFRRLSFPEALNVYSIANKKERAQVKNILRAKYIRAHRKTPDEIKMFKELMKE